jgi:acetyl esterase/lipase
MIVLPNQEYARPSGLPLAYDLIRPDTGVPPLVIFVHGGGWISGDRSMYRDEAVWLAEQGYACALIDYRLAPLHPYPAAVHDVSTFMQYARREHEELQIDPNRVVAFGNSAGGHLASMLGVLGPERANAVVAISGIADLTNPEDAHLPIAMAFLEQFMGCSYQGNEERWREASPITHVSPEAPPFLIMHGDLDDIVPLAQSERFRDALEGQGVPVSFHRLAGEGHSFTWEGWMRIRERYTGFLSELFASG